MLEVITITIAKCGYQPSVTAKEIDLTGLEFSMEICECKWT